MLDIGSLIAIITASGALVVSIITHIKHSECWGVSIDTTTPAIDRNITQV
jgi:antitoxin (DNA-binding transcriptional repressor) of toxin-antitoxin stability system